MLLDGRLPANGVNSIIPDSTPSYTYSNLTATTVFKALVQNGSACPIDTSSGATITVFQKSVGGEIDPPNTNFCANQTVADILNLNNSTGQVVNWQSSQDSVNWQSFAPVNNRFYL